MDGLDFSEQDAHAITGVRVDHFTLQLADMLQP